MLPIAHEPGEKTTFIEALFTATSAVCVNGLVIVDTSKHWSMFGELVILVGIQAGGFGIMTLASLLGLLLSRRMGLQTRLTTAAETHAMGVGNIRRVVRNVAIGLAVTEFVLAVILTIRLMTHYDHDFSHAIYSGIFHSVSAVCNAGFSLYSNGLIDFVKDPFFCIPIACGVILGGIGFPVLFELKRRWRTPSMWSVHTRVTILGTGILLAVGTMLVTTFEWSNPHTLGPLNATESIVAGFFQAVMPRSAGYNILDIGAMHSSTLLGIDGLMFIGGGSGGTAGGIKVTTFMILFFAIIAEVRGDRDINAFGRRIASNVIRLALSIALLGVGIVASGTMFLLAVTDLSLDQVLFEATSAFGTTGLSTGITPHLPPVAQYAIVVLMFLGRTGSVTFATAFAVRSRKQVYRLPEEHPIVG